MRLQYLRTIDGNLLNRDFIVLLYIEKGFCSEFNEDKTEEIASIVYRIKASTQSAIYILSEYDHLEVAKIRLDDLNFMK